MRRALLAALLTAAVAPAAASVAQDEAAPSRKPGWWELQLVISGPTAVPVHQTRRMCTDAAFDKIDSPLGVNMRGQGCAPLSTSRIATGWTRGDGQVLTAKPPGRSSQRPARDSSTRAA